MDNECLDDESEDQMSLDEAKSQIDSDMKMEEEEEEECEIITVSEAAVDEQKYDQDIDMVEEKAAIEKLKRMFIAQCETFV